MRKYLTYIILAALTLLASGCKKETDADRKDLDSRERVPISVTYSDAGSPLTALSFTHGAIQKDIDVELNNETLHWSIESDKSWCKILPGEHIGSGSFTIEIEANENFEAREDATLTFVAGEYRGSTIRVSQTGSAFIISHPYLIFPRLENPFEVNVTTLIDQEWQFEHDEWLTVEPMTSSTEGDKKITTLKIWGSDNNDDSRYGRVILSAGEEQDIISIYQFGQDYTYDGEGHIFFPNDEPASISFIAPTYMIKEINAPSYASSSAKENGDGTDTITIEFEDNLSDCEMLREIPVSVVLNNEALSTIALPAMVQDFLPAGGLMTAEGLKTFAAKVAAGESTESWETDGVVKVLQDIDMNNVTDWTGVGTAEHPFAGVLDGENHSIINFSNASAPLFNICDGATIKNLSIDKHSSFYFESADTVGVIASKAISTTFDRCGFAGSLEYAGNPDLSIIGGIVGYADATSTINMCKMSGSIILSSGTKADAICMTGGIAGHCEGAITNSECTGSVNCMSGIPNVRIGGITSILDDGASVSGNAFSGEIIINGSSTHIAVGGLYGHLKTGNWTFNSESDMSLSSGAIKIIKFAASKDVSRVFAGGFVGLIGEGVGLTAKGYTFLTNFTLDMKTNEQYGAYLNCGGFLGSCEPDATAGTMLFDHLENQGVIDIQFSTSVYNVVRRMCIGGIAGLVRGLATFDSCVNKGEIGKNEVYSSGTKDSAGNRPGNGMTEIIGGIAGQAYGGNVTFTKCVNDSKLCNGHYNNNASNGTYGNFLTPPCTGGILGAFNFKPTPENIQLTLENCSSTGNIWAIRGFVGGVVGFAKKATITGCSWKGASDGANLSQASFKSGIAGGLASATVSNCTVNAGLIVAHKGGSAEAADAGGIVARVIAGDPVTISGCKFYGELNCSATGGSNFAGGIASTVQSNTVIQNCSFGGKVLGTTVTDNTVTAKAVGNGTCSVEGISLWNGI